MFFVLLGVKSQIIELV